MDKTNLKESSLSEECMICLESISPFDKVGKVPCCSTKMYHDQCILQWSQKSNSCPTCRNRFHKIEISMHNKIINSIAIKDKLLPNPAINDIPSQYIINDRILSAITTNRTITTSIAEEVEEELIEGVCYICSINSRNGIICQNCGCNFHLNCLGVIEVNDLFTWCCPICDCNQETWVPRRTRRITPWLEVDHQESRGSRRSRNTNGLVIHNDNDELDVDFLYNNDYNDDGSNGGILENSLHRQYHVHLHHNPVINGGVISRREQRQREQLTNEEVQSWEIFDEARKNSEIEQHVGTSESTNTTCSSNAPFLGSLNERTVTRQRRKRKKVTPIETITSTSSGMSTISSDGGSRISQLIDQVKTSNGKVSTTYNQQISPPPQKQQRALLVTPLASTTYYPQSSSDSPMSVSPAANSPMELVSYSSDDNDYTRLQQQQQMSLLNQFRRELTLDQKVEIQKHIRNKLRPKYKPNEINNNTDNNSSEIITSEEDYIKINKTISRKIYNYILKQKLNEIDEFFTNQDKLRNLIDKYIE